jgi:hypothetical protein
MSAHIYTIFLKNKIILLYREKVLYLAFPLKNTSKKERVVVVRTLTVSFQLRRHQPTTIFVSEATLSRSSLC